MPALIALAVSIGVLAVIATWLALGPLAAFNAQIWQIFIAWACFYHSGGKTEGAQKTVTCMSFGAVDGMLSVLLIGQLGALGALAAPVAVGLGAAGAWLLRSCALLGNWSGRPETWVIKCCTVTRSRPSPMNSGKYF